MKTLVTGGAGFIGSNLTHRLIGEGHQVVVYDDLSRAGVDHNVAWLRAEHGDKWTLMQADVRDFETLRRAAADVDIVDRECRTLTVVGRAHPLPSTIPLFWRCT